MVLFDPSIQEGEHAEIALALFLNLGLTRRLDKVWTKLTLTKTMHSFEFDVKIGGNLDIDSSNDDKIKLQGIDSPFSFTDADDLWEGKTSKKKAES
mmetsp:Transcript_28871/g.45263  ORF Transcript_28871/g.45263 Transcript_28871/m.45263 type:complete len:96 (+) Transcript_28871:184-471(+)